jgi:hypothetical protein
MASAWSILLIAIAQVAPSPAAPREDARTSTVRVLAQSAVAQPTSRPAGRAAAWASTVAAFGSALASQGDTDTIVADLVVSEAMVRQFSRNRRASLPSLRHIASGATLITTRGYLTTPDTLATDVAADIQNAALPDSVKRRLTPADDADLKRANTVASKWIASSLLTGGAEPVGLIVLWHPGADDAEPATDRKSEEDDDANANARLPLFIVVKGEQVRERFVITQICYGNPLALAEE